MAKKAGGAGDFLKKPAGELEPFKKQPMRNAAGIYACIVRETIPAEGPPIGHGISGNRFAMAMPPEIGKGPIRAREKRVEKQVDGYS